MVEDPISYHPVPYPIVSYPPGADPNIDPNPVNDRVAIGTYY